MTICRSCFNLCLNYYYDERPIGQDKDKADYNNSNIK